MVAVATVQIAGLIVLLLSHGPSELFLDLIRTLDIVEAHLLLLALIVIDLFGWLILVGLVACVRASLSIRVLLFSLRHL